MTRRRRRGDVHVQLETRTPAETTLRLMSRTAHAAARTWTLRRWVGRLAARAGPHDYRGQLRQVFGDLVRRRWRYVMEPDEWICGTARALLGHVLGARYNRGPRCADELRCDVLETPWRQRGWGDCDDVATLVAAAALALGMRPRWRVSQSPAALHVAVEVETPTGERIPVDPVAYPQHKIAGEPLAGFGWGHSGPDVLVRLVELEEPRGGGGMGRLARRRGRVHTNEGQRMRAPVRAVIQPSTTAAHWVAVGPRDRRGARVLAMPGRLAHVFRNGRVVDGAPAVDQFGALYAYSANLDLWVPARDYGRMRRKRPGLVRLRRGLQRFVQGARKVVGKVLSNKWVAGVIGGALQAFGIPLPLTYAMLKAVGGVMQSGGIVQLIRLARKDPKEALRTLAKAVFAAGKGDLFKKFGAKMKFSGVNDTDVDPVVLSQSGGQCFAAPVSLFLGLGAVEGGVEDDAPDDIEDDVPLPDETQEFSGPDVATSEPTPGAHYQTRTGDTVLGIAGRAARVGAGAARLAYAQAIAAHPSNASTLRPPRNRFEEDNFPGGLPSLARRPVLFMPELSADQPPLPGPLPPGQPGPGRPSGPGPVAPAPEAGGGGWVLPALLGLLVLS